MSTVYREGISGERLQAVADHVRSWLFPPEANPAGKNKPAEEKPA